MTYEPSPVGMSSRRSQPRRTSNGYLVVAGLDESVADLRIRSGRTISKRRTSASVEAATEDAPIVKLVNMLISKAAADSASDIHVEPTDKDLRIQIPHRRRTARGHAYASIVANSVVSRLKIMADVDIAERRRPQDGRISLRAGSRTIDLRVSSLPTIYGEKVVMRILDNSQPTLRTRGPRASSPTPIARYEEPFTKPYGTILVTGPTGSGKSTTLYATSQRAQPARGQHRHRRGSGRIPPERYQPGPGESRRPA